jgi:hypothetical protein
MIKIKSQSWYWYDRMETPCQEEEENYVENLNNVIVVINQCA